ncbi:hypothetical protein Cri9333_2504 [Crinalium epipsammum PCC 9333]|uniref:DSP-PTPase phosphatase fused to NAD+ Kinase domain-containing protein n=1 Tax=Crinalium epipsammum PCC 9333 TaxID=1173022 RepID=K9W1R5_9CYAN|nr:protein tyrosine phosphatase family protein [Crinalium epipsammum]AFZ13370.1 hypothetical protein Cri9333_2504 [Crinalium epipsammum PCC 9333]
MANNGIENIYNFFKISEFIATAGQPTLEQLTIIKLSNYQAVINLALLDSPNALPNEESIVKSLGMEYIHLPVIWENPTIEDITRFFSLMKNFSNKRVFIHCAANKRVSAFIYLYRIIYQKINKEQAQKDLHQIWIPNEKWQNFIQQVTDNC